MTVFDDRAAEWDTPERRERTHALADAIRAHVPLTPEMRAIDIGAGTGLLGLELLYDVGSVVLADPSEGMVEATRRKIEAEGIVGAEAIVFDFPSDDRPRGAPFDLAVSSLALHHVEDTAATLRAIHATLAPGGQIGLIDLDQEDGSFHSPDEPGIYHQGFDAKTLATQAAAAGFRDAQARVVHELERDGRPYPLLLLTGRRN